MRKSDTFRVLVPVQRRRKIEEKKVFFWGICTGPNALFFDLNFGAAFGTWYYLQSTRYQIRGLPVIREFSYRVRTLSYTATVRSIDPKKYCTV